MSVYFNLRNTKISRISLAVCLSYMLRGIRLMSDDFSPTQIYVGFV